MNTASPSAHPADQVAARRHHPGQPWIGLVGLAALLALAAAWRARFRRRGARIAAAEARMEPKPVVY
jgi:hypothetical protein